MAFAIRFEDQTHARKRAGGSSAGMRSALLKRVHREASAEQWSGNVQRKVWDLSKHETKDRLCSALDGVWRAYVTAMRTEAMPQMADPVYLDAYARVSVALDEWEASR